MLNHIAQQIIAQQQHTLPDLSNMMIVLPNYHVAKPLSIALSQASGLPTLLLPQMVTLMDWACTVPLDNAICPNTQRMTALYQALREQNWFEGADLWSLSGELLDLIDELTAHHVQLPETCDEFTEQLITAYQARSGAALQFEARVVHELWYAMTASGDLDVLQAYQQRLARLAQTVEMPVYVLLTSDLSKPEQLFFSACQAPVTFFDIRELVLEHPPYQLLNAALRANQQDLRSSAAALASEANLSQRLQLQATHGLENEAHVADVQIRRWLLQGKQSIAVVVLDRLVARRVRALLERAQVMVLDETGWTFATLSVSTVLMRWFDVLQNEAYYLDLLDLLKSPFLFADGASSERKHAAFLLEKMTRKHGVVSHLDKFIEQAQAHSDYAELIQPLVRLRQAAQVLPKKNSTLYDWLSALQHSLEILGVNVGWAQDMAGQQLMQLFHQWRDELRSDTTRFSLSEIRRWLAQQLDSNTFRDLSVDSPVIFTHLPATRWRSFDAVLLLGSDDKHLPSPAKSGQWFNDAVRSSLGLPLSAAQQAITRDDLLALLVMNTHVVATWQDNKNGEPNLLSPCFEMIRALHLLAYQQDLASPAQSLAHVMPQDGVAYSIIQSPSAPLALIPEHITPYGYNSLMACPYQYYARHMLSLNPLDEVRETLGKRDYGVWVHSILQRFHKTYAKVSAHSRDEMEQALYDISLEVFDKHLQYDYQAQAWLIRWRKQIASYIDWQLSNEAQGWFYQSAEVVFNKALDSQLAINGRIDRIDVNDAGELRVFDYKTNKAADLKARLKRLGEDTQLPSYSYACDAAESAFVALDGGKIEAVAPSEDISEENAQRLLIIFKQMRDGTALPAHGLAQVCDYCEVSGVCRKGYRDSGELAVGSEQ